MNINDNYFDGIYKDLWRAIIPAELTARETDFMVQHFKLSPASKVLDLMCGYGRHSIALAGKGINVTAIDNLDEYIKEISKAAEQGKLPIRAIKGDVLGYKIDEQYDLALCMGNSLNFFGAADVQRLLSNVSAHLRPSGHLLINTWSLAEIAIRTFAARSWNEINGVKHICESEYLFHPTRVESRSTFLAANGVTEEKKAVDYIFSVSEMEALLNGAGFKMNDIFSIPGKKKFTLGEPRAYIVGQKGLM